MQSTKLKPGSTQQAADKQGVFNKHSGLRRMSNDTGTFRMLVYLCALRPRVGR
jgi:hypothetical protein